MKKNQSKLPLTIIGLVAVVAIIGTLLFLRSGAKPPTPLKNGNTTQANKAPKDSNALANASPGAQPAWAKGPATAPIVIEEFADFECPSCAGFEPVIRQIKTIYGDKVRVIFRHYPLTQIHQKAYDAARATEAAGMQNKFWEMHDLLYDKQKSWTTSGDHRAEFANYAQQIGLDVERFKTDMLGMVTAQRVDADKKRGDSVRIASTPSAFLNGRPLDFTTEMSNTDALRRVVESALQGK
ncbi:MAG TPA: thioredoxin domain-containing protein [Pyrinomonadaceae bacterium]|jgi:protein-disulfide isomerase